MLILQVLLATNLMVAAWLTFRGPASRSVHESAYDQLATYRLVLEQVHANYVDEGLSSYSNLVEASLKGMLADLDPYSQYMDSNAHHDMQDESRGEFGGVGVTVSMREGHLTVIAPMEGTPAFRAGIMPGDKIVAINSNVTEGLSLAEGIDLMRGEVDEDIRLDVKNDDEGLRSVVMKREVIKLPTVRDAKLLEDETGVGYIRLTQFSEPTASDLEAALTDLLHAGMKELVLDLRGNPGGLLDSAVDIADLFLDGRPLIVSIRGRELRDERTFRGGQRSEFEEIPMVVLVDGGSASASEIVAGSLKDYGRAKLVGMKTFGKGSVQKIIPVRGDDGPAIRLTTAKYYTQSGNMIHGKGIMPDVEIDMNSEQMEKLLRYRIRPESFDEKPLDPQLEKALDVLREERI